MADYDLVVLGSGPGGYVAAIRAGQLGMKTALVEKDEVGGICLNWGCIPSKALLRNAEVLSLVQKAEEFGISFSNLQYDFGKAIDRSRQVVNRLTGGIKTLLKKNKVEHINGVGVIVDRNTVRVENSNTVLSTNNIIVATGARERELPSLPIDRNTVITSREALALKEIPARVVIVGGGATGVEFAHIYRTYGAEVTIVELLSRLIPLEDEEISNHLERTFKRNGINIMTNSRVENISVEGAEAKVSISHGEENLSLECDKVLVVVGIQGNVEGIGLEETGIISQNGSITIDDRMQTNVSGIYAIGDVTGILPLAHVASAQGVTAVEAIAGMNPPPLDYTMMPKAIYCKPQVASLGLTESKAREQGHTVTIGKFPFAASGKALALGEVDGMVKLVVDSETNEVLGAHMLGGEVTELLGELALSKLLEGTVTELGWLVHPHPTISEVVKEAALAAEGQAIHI